MATYILAALFLAGVVMLITFRGNWELDWVGGYPMVLAVLIWIALSFFTLVAEDGKGVLTPADCDAELVAMSTGQNTTSNGSFFLGSGTFNSEGYQTVTFLKKSDGGVRLSEVRADEAVIFEDGGAYMTCTQEVKSHKSDWMWPWAGETTRYGSLTYEFHVPEGSVVQQFTVSP